MELTADQARILARSYFDLAQKLGEYRFDKFDALTPAKRKKIEEFERALLDSSTAFTAMAMSISLADLEPVLTRIGEVTTTMKDNINELQKVDRVLKIAGSAVQLAGAILTGNPEAIFKAAGESASLFA
ncbi:hypothetical protein [Spirosoma radiotolerans]|uniref:Uncharacterized protein n=1 Tax=Spirosoma radiotolerans TaxID=1379870 RepID=A0A0E3ZXC2_9BACT|nr:hypothetical protein [Spirosoma radiotolerans]AKD56108.1 hypothetical protein SD10_15595 [Spirosoma radiotolerans]